MYLTEILHWSLGPHQRRYQPIRGEPDTVYQLWDIWLADLGETLMNTKKCEYKEHEDIMDESRSSLEPLNEKKVK